MKKTYEVMISAPPDCCITIDADNRESAIATALKEYTGRHYVEVYRAEPKEKKKYPLLYPRPHR